MNSAAGRPPIRRAVDGDADEIIRVYLASTIPGQAFLPETFWRAGVDEIRTELLPIAETWVIEHEHRIVAFVALLGDLIGGLFTDPDHQGRGHGSALIEHAHRFHDPIFVEVFAANTAARRFYAQRGFVDHEQGIEPTSGLVQLTLRLART